MRNNLSIWDGSALAVVRLSTLAVVAGLLVGQTSARAVPVLQLYIEGAEYDADTETWTLSVNPVESDEFAFRLWAVGFVDNSPGGYIIKDVRLAAAYSSDHIGNIEIGLSPALAFGDGYVPESAIRLDTKLPVAPVQNGVGEGLPYPWRSFVRTEVENEMIEATVGNGLSDNGEVLNGGVPVLGVVDNPDRGLSPHGLYGPETVWREFALGDFDDVGDPDDADDNAEALVGDLIDGFDPADFSKPGQINAYDVTITGGLGATVSFDLYDTVQVKNKAKFAPFSHDVAAHITPEPSGIAVWSLLVAIGAAAGWWRRRWRAA